MLLFIVIFLSASVAFLLLQVTGSGKTLAFVIPIVELLLKREEKLKKMQVRTESESLVYLYYILKGGSGGEEIGAFRASCFWRLGLWWSLPQENWLFRSVRWWNSFYKGSRSLREWSLPKFLLGSSFRVLNHAPTRWWMIKCGYVAQFKPTEQN